MPQRTHKIVALIMVMVLLAVSASCGCAGEFPVDAPQKAKQKVAKQPAGAGKAADSCAHCPSCPDDNDADSDHCDSCSCPCHASLLVQPIRLIVSELVSPLSFHEPFTYLPQVYLSKFIPPQNAA